MRVTLVQQEVVKKWNATFASGSDKQYPSLDLVRLEKWHFGGVGQGKMLEYAFGSGVNLIHLLKCGYTIEAMDAASEAAKLVTRKLNALPELRERANLHIVDPNATRLPFDDETFDFVNCMNVLSLLSSPERVEMLVCELKRVMKPGAKIILDINGPEADFARCAEPLGNDIYCFRGIDGSETPVPTYCPANAESFADFVRRFFEVDDVGFTHHKYFKSEIVEFIVCAHKAA